MANEKRLIDAKALEKQIKQAFEDTNPYAIGIMLRWIRKQTKVDAVEVVRCKDCKHCRLPWLEGQTMGKCMFGRPTVVELEHFCSCGERKDNG